MSNDPNLTYLIQRSNDLAQRLEATLQALERQAERRSELDRLYAAELATLKADVRDATKELQEITLMLRGDGEARKGLVARHYEAEARLQKLEKQVDKIETERGQLSIIEQQGKHQWKIEKWKLIVAIIIALITGAAAWVGFIKQLITK